MPHVNGTYFLNKLSGHFGYLLTKKGSAPTDISSIDPDFIEMYARCMEFTMTSVERAYALYKSIEYIVTKSIKGDIVECGVWRGGSAMLCALALKHFGDTTRTIHLYDTYKGMTEPMRNDFRLSTHAKAEMKWENMERNGYNEWAYATLEEAKKNLASTGYAEEYLHYIVGDVRETIPFTTPKHIALLRLDTDWYESTKHELMYLFPLLCSGGVLIIDDYGEWAGAKRATDEFFSNKPMLLNRIDNTGRIGVKP